MIDFKVSLTVAVPGTVQYSKEQCYTTRKMIVKGQTCVVDDPIKSKLDSFTAHVPRKDAQGNTILKKFPIYTPKRKPVNQVINMSSTAYDAMTDGNSCPEWFRVHGKNPTKEWKLLTQNERLEKHLERIASDLGGVVVSYNIADE